MTLVLGNRRLDANLSIEILFSVLFICTLVNMPDTDFQQLANRLGLTDRFRIYAALILIACVGMAVYRYSRVISGYIFILLFYVVNTQMRYRELFQAETTTTTSTNPIKDPLNLTPGDLSLAEDFLIKQTQSDPNKTQLEKNVVTDIIKQYFLKSNKLTELRDFNDRALQANPVAGASLDVTGLAAGVQ
jgi:hypothetical protein